MGIFAGRFDGYRSGPPILWANLPYRPCGGRQRILISFLRDTKNSMANPNSVSIGTLREAINGVFDFVEKDLGMSEVELKKNYYWDIPEDELYSMENQPKELVVGSLIDDWGVRAICFQNGPADPN